MTCARNLVVGSTLGWPMLGQFSLEKGISHFQMTSLSNQGFWSRGQLHSSTTPQIMENNHTRLSYIYAIFWRFAIQVLVPHLSQTWVHTRLPSLGPCTAASSWTTHVVQDLAKLESPSHFWTVSTFYTPPLLAVVRELVLTPSPLSCSHMKVRGLSS